MEVESCNGPPVAPDNQVDSCSCAFAKRRPRRILCSPQARLRWSHSRNTAPALDTSAATTREWSFTLVCLNNPYSKCRGPGRPPRLDNVFQRYDPPLYFVTLCSNARRHFFANDVFHDAFRQFALRGYVEKQIAIGRYVLMPDHVHLFVRGGFEFRLSQWVRIFKRALSKTLAELGHAPEHWQRGFFDHLIRSAESYDQKWTYVSENPARAGLIANPEDWPWQGEIVHIDRA
jgi:putative transposase